MEPRDSRAIPDPQEVLNVCTGELYRYRLALHDQEERVAASVEQLRARREEIDEEVWELLFSPDWTEEWFGEQYELLSNHDIPEIWRLKTAGQYLLVAVRGIYMMARSIAKAGDGELAWCASEAVAAFEKEVPDALLLRHIHEHLDEYIAGRGHLRHLLPDAFAESAVAMLDQGLAYFIGGRLFLLWEISASAERLAGAVAACTIRWQPMTNVSPGDE